MNVLNACDTTAATFKVSIHCIKRACKFVILYIFLLIRCHKNLDFPNIIARILKFPYTSNRVARLQGNVFSCQTLGGKTSSRKNSKFPNILLRKISKDHIYSFSGCNFSQYFSFWHNLQMFLRNRWHAANGMLYLMIKPFSLFVYFRYSIRFLIKEPPVYYWQLKVLSTSNTLASLAIFAFYILMFPNNVKAKGNCKHLMFATLNFHKACLLMWSYRFQPRI